MPISHEEAFALVWQAYVNAPAGSEEKGKLLAQAQKIALQSVKATRNAK